VDADALDLVAGLADPVRRRLYAVVADAPEPITKDDAAAAVGISRSLAAYHLERLAADGLLATSFARRSGRQGPGAGRPAKLYRPTQAEVQLQLPPRDDRLLAQLLAAAIEASDSAETREALLETARAEGERAARELSSGDRKRVLALLASRGYAPCVRDGDIQLRNCPFHHLVEDHRDLVCTLNLALLDAIVTAKAKRYHAELDPQPNNCCVVLRDQNGDR
jgi:predicted ArsR family transcriptional regulator